MLKRIFSLSLVLFLFTTLLCGCSVHPSPSKEDKADADLGDLLDSVTTAPTADTLVTAPTETNAPTQPVTTPPTQPEAPVQTPTADPAPWKQAYIQYIANFEANTECDYRLFYLDGDSIPELFISGCCEAQGTTVCTYSNGQVVYQQLNRIGGAAYIPQSGLISNFNGNMGYYSLNVYQLQNGSFVRLLQGLHVVEYINGEETNSYFLYDQNGNETAVTQEAFSAAESAVFDHGQAQVLYEYNSPNMRTYDQIMQELSN